MQTLFQLTGSRTETSGNINFMLLAWVKAIGCLPTWRINNDFQAQPSLLFQHAMYTCHCSYNFHASQWPTVIIVIYDQRRSAMVADLSHNPILGNLQPPHRTPPLLLKALIRRAVLVVEVRGGSSLHLFVGSARHTPVAPWMLMWGPGRRRGVAARYREQLHLVCNAQL